MARHIERRKFLATLGGARLRGRSRRARSRPRCRFSEQEIDHFVMAITPAEATVRYTTLQNIP
jgi:hypothetical protein